MGIGLSIRLTRHLVGIGRGPARRARDLSETRPPHRAGQPPASFTKLYARATERKTGSPMLGLAGVSPAIATGERDDKSQHRSADVYRACARRGPDHWGADYGVRPG